MEQHNNKRGGKRANSGPKNNVPSKVVRMPEDVLAEIKRRYDGACSPRLQAWIDKQSGK